MMVYRISGLVEPTIDIYVDQIYDLLPEIRYRIEDYISSVYIGRVCSRYTMIITNDILRENEIEVLLVESIDFRYDVALNSDHYIDEFVQHLNSLNGMNITTNTSLGESVMFHLFLKDDMRNYSTIPYDFYKNWSIESYTPVPMLDLLSLSFEENGRLVIPFFTWNEDPNSCYTPGIRLFDLNACPMFTLNTTEFGLVETPRGIKYEHNENIVIGLSEYTHNQFDMSMIRLAMTRTDVLFVHKSNVTTLVVSLHN